MALGPDPPLQRLELSEGELIVTPSGTRPHNRVRDRLCAHLTNFVDHRGLGEVTAETDTRLGPATVRRPDVALYCPATLAGVNPDLLPQPRPDIAFEVVSANDRVDDLMLKVSQYLGAGGRAVWLLFPRLGMAHRYHNLAAPPAVVSTFRGEAIAEPDLLPGWELPLAELFAGITPPNPK
jgi:Uma2 family endonuclease